MIRAVQLSSAMAMSIAATLMPSNSARACTTLCMSRGAQVVVAKSYDFGVGHGLLVTNRRGVSKQALLVSPSGARPVNWVSSHGSVTFNQYGRELPLGGMNERGLVVEIMWLNATRHPPLDPGRETVNELQLIQYLLDRCATVQEAVAEARRLQVEQVHASVHYMVCDRQGACATIEDLGGQRVIMSGNRDLPYRVLTNNPYAVSLGFLRRHRGFGGKLPLPTSASSRDRFVRAAEHGRAFATSRTNAVPSAFAALEDVRQGDYTKWQIVYEPGAGRVHFRKAGEKGHTSVELAGLRHGCDQPVQVMDVFGTLTRGAGGPRTSAERSAQDVTGAGRRAFVPYTRVLNAELIQRSFKQLGVRFPPPMLSLLASYPESTRCGADRPGADASAPKASPKPSPKPSALRGM